MLMYLSEASCALQESSETSRHAGSQDALFQVRAGGSNQSPTGREVSFGALSCQCRLSYVCRLSLVVLQDIRDEFLSHFQTGDFICDRVYEVQLAKTLLPQITLEELQGLAEEYRSSSNCLVKAVSHAK